MEMDRGRKEGGVGNEPQNQWEQLAWQGIRKRSWQTKQTSSSGGTGDTDEVATAAAELGACGCPARRRRRPSEATDGSHPPPRTATHAVIGDGMGVGLDRNGKGEAAIYSREA